MALLGWRLVYASLVYAIGFNIVFVIVAVVAPARL
jgi:hypothetical protein